MPEEDDARVGRMITALRATADLLEARLSTPAATPALRLVPSSDTRPDPGPPGLQLTA